MGENQNLPGKGAIPGKGAPRGKRDSPDKETP